MADRYWVGGSGTWDAASTANWSETSGGTGGASAPTSLDDVYFDSGSDIGVNFTVTVGTGAVCKTLNANTASPLDFTMTLAGSAALSIHGSLYFPALRLASTYTGAFTFKSPDKNNIISTNGILLNIGSYRDAFVFDNIDGEWRLASSLNFIGVIRLIKGTLDTNGYNITGSNVSAIVDQSNSVFKLKLQNSQVLINFLQLISNNTEIDAGTSTVTLYLDSEIRRQGSSLYNLRIAWGFTSPVIRIPSILNNFIIEATGGLEIGNNMTIGGNLVIGGPDTRFPAVINGQSYLITVLGGISIRNHVLVNLNLTGPSTPYIVDPIHRVGNMGNNIGIIFPQYKTVYWNNPTGGSFDSNSYATTPGGSVSQANFPVFGDTVVFTDAGLNSGAVIGGGTSTRSYCVGVSIDCSSRTLPMTINNDSSVLSSVNLSSSVTFKDLRLTAYTKNTVLNCNSASILGDLVLNSLGFFGSRTVDPYASNHIRTIELASDMQLSGQVLLSGGGLHLSGFKLVSSSFQSSNSNVRTLNMNGGTLWLTGSGTTLFNATTSTNLTVQGPGTINMTSSSAKTFAGGSANYSGVILNQGGSGELTITGNNQFGGISNTVRPSSIKFAAGSTTTLGKFMLNGSDGAPVTISSTTTGTRYTLTSSAGVFAPYYTSIRDSNATGGAVWRAPINYGNVNVSNNLGWDFSTINTLTDNFMVLFPSNLHLTS